MSTNYSRGANFERRCKKSLESKGAFVIRSAGSHSPVDLVVFWGAEIWFLQCKTDGKISKGERETLTYLAGEHKCLARLAYRNGKVITYETIY